jgi:hypothetical protein
MEDIEKNLLSKVGGSLFPQASRIGSARLCGMLQTRRVSAAVVLFILIVNRLVWQPAYDLAQRRFALNY